MNVSIIADPRSGTPDHVDEHYDRWGIVTQPRSPDWDREENPMAVGIACDGRCRMAEAIILSDNAAANIVFGCALDAADDSRPY